MYQDLYTRLSQNMPLPDAPAAPTPAPYGSTYGSAPAYGAPFGGSVMQVDAPTPGPSYGSRAAPASAASIKNLPPSLGGPGARVARR
jgi:hypothetical protein